MASVSRIPHILEPYLALPSEGSLNLVTSVLGASSNWLLLRHVYSYLRGSTDGDESTKDTGVVLVSFMRDGAFWREGSTKLVSSLYLQQFFFVDT
jgi:elongator complex protein 6